MLALVFNKSNMRITAGFSSKM